MKLFFLAALIFAVNAFSSEQFTGGKYYSQIQYLYTWSSAPINDYSSYNKSAYAGRCFSSDDSKPYGAQLVFENILYDNGPIGTPGDYISYAGFNISDNETEYDNVSWQYSTFKKSQLEFDQPEMANAFNTFSSNSYYKVRFRKDSSKDYFYATVTVENNYVMACYFFKNNH
jgi:hypothetical protein